jgi:hypothetical protein
MATAFTLYVITRARPANPAATPAE